MKPRTKRPQGGDKTEDLLRKILITQLTLARAPQQDIARVLGMSKSSVNAIARFIKLPRG